jgi:hypothetical protein
MEEIMSDLCNCNVTRSGGIGFSGLLTIVFIAMKLTGYIDWPWIWVLAPTWISLLIAIVLLGVIGVIAVAAQR